MAGETPGASRAQQEREARRRKLLSQGIARTADEAYYRGSAKSTIQGTITRADSKGRPGDKPKPPVKPKVRQADLLISADAAYYANPTKQEPTPEAVAAAKARAKKPDSVVKAAAPSTERGEYDEIAIATDSLGTAIYRSLIQGSKIVTVQTEKDLSRAKARIDSLVTRELVDEEVARNMYAVLDNPAITETATIKVEPVPQPVVEATIESTPVIEDTVTEEVAAESDEPSIDDFLAGPAKDPLLSVTVEPVIAVEPSVDVPVETSVEEVKTEAPAQPGRRKGRGTR